MQDKILESLLEYGPTGSYDLWVRVGGSLPVLTRAIRELKDAGKIEVVVQIDGKVKLQVADGTPDA